MDRIAFIIGLTLIVVGASFAFGVYTAVRQTFLFTGIQTFWQELEVAWTEKENIIKSRPTHWTDQRRFDGNGVIVDEITDRDSDLILLQGFFEDGLEIRLIRRSGEPVRRWRIKGLELVKRITHIRHIRNVPATDWNFDTHGVVALSDGSIVFNLDGVGLFKLDRCGREVWHVDEPTHHSVELNSDGSFWVPSTRNHWEEREAKLHPLFKPPVAEDTLLKVSPDGNVLEEIPLINAFFASDLVGLLTLTGGPGPSPMQTTRYDFSKEVFHLNDVEALPEALADDFPAFEAGDLLISLRNRNLILVLDRTGKRIKWWRIGNWVRQHDPDWKRGGTISVFDNNRDGTVTGEYLGSSKIVEVSIDSQASNVLYGSKDSEFFHSTRRGKHQVLDNGHLLITDAEAGRVIEVDGERKTVWEYVNGYDDAYTARISEAIAYPRGYFAVRDWRCQGD